MKKLKNTSAPLADFIGPALRAKYSMQLDAAEDIGVSPSRLSAIMNRRSPSVSEETIRKICRKLGLSEKEGVLRLQKARELKIKQFHSRP